MNEEDVHSFIISIPSTRNYAESSIGRKKNKKGLKPQAKPVIEPSDISLRKYSLPGNKPIKVKNIKNEEILLPYKIYLKVQGISRNKQWLKISTYDRYKIIKTDLRKRLHVSNPPDDVYAITDVNKDFFRDMDGRPLEHHISLFKSLKFLINEQFRFKQEIGYRNDCILNIETNYRKELKVYDLTVQRCMNQARYFDKFISEDYQKSMVFLEECDELQKKVNIKNVELQNLAAEKFTIMSRLIGIDYMYGVQQKYGRFLYYLSPATWRLKNRNFARSIEIAAKGFDFGNSSEEDTFTVIFEKLQKQCFEKIDPVLYFSHPDDLMKVFEAIEKQQLNCYTHVTNLTPHAKMLQEGIKSLKDLIATDSAVIINAIKNFKTLLELLEERSAQLEVKFFKIVNGLFYQSVGKVEVLKLIIHLEFCFEKIYGEKPVNVDMRNIAETLENMYMYYTRRLDEIQGDTLRHAESHCLELDQQNMRRAKMAARELRLFERLERALLRSFAPITRNQCIPLLHLKRSPQKKVKCENSKVNVVENSPCVTEAEQEFLRIETDFEI